MDNKYYIICDTEELAEQSIDTLEKAGADIVEIYSPNRIGKNKNPKKSFYIGLTSFLSGAIGLTLSIFFQYWISMVDYPINVGGKPFFEVVYSVPVTFAITSLFAAIGGIICFFVLSGLPNWNEKKIGDMSLPTDKYVIKFSIGDSININSLNLENMEVVKLK